MVNYKQLLAFVTVVEEGGFSAAAKKLFITQPAVSWQIKSMEKALDVLLIERSERDIMLTQAGEIFFRNAKIIIEQYRMLDEDIEQFKTHENGTIRIAASTIPGEYLLPNLIKQFKSEQPYINTKVYISDSKDVIEKVMSGSVCMGITGIQPVELELESIAFAEDRLKLVCSIDYATQKIKDFRAIVKEPIVMREEGSGTRAVTMSFLKENGCPIDQLNKNTVFGSTKSSLSAVEAGLGIGWLSEAALSDALKLNNIRVLSDVYDIPRQLYIVTYKNRTLSHSAEVFRAFLLKSRMSGCVKQIDSPNNSVETYSGSIQTLKQTKTNQ